MNLFIAFVIGMFLLGIQWRKNAGKSRAKRLLPVIFLVTFAYYFLNMV